VNSPTPSACRAAAIPGLHVKDIVVSCADTEALAAFWSALLDRPIAARIGPYVLLERQDGLGLTFQAVPAGSLGTGTIHLDLGAANPAAEQARIEALGGRRVEGYEDGGFLVMADPEGNLFCVLPAGPFDVDDQGRASYLSSPPEAAEGL
jgi:hypothetical protein